MREIKFRAWDKKNKKMLPYDVRERNYFLSLFLSLPKQYDVMQYTCLKDKNGKEIYEGDIVSASESLESKSYWIVEYSVDACFIVVRSRERYPLASLNKPKIIGNIYENGELLDEK